MRLCETDQGTYCRTVSGLYYFHAGNLLFYNELDKLNHVYPKDYDEEVEIIPAWPGLTEGEGFSLVNSPKLPYDRLLFKTDKGFRFKMDMNDYRIKIPFYFQSTDERIGKTIGKWTARSGRILNAIVGQQLSIFWDNLTPVLHVGFSMTIPSQ